MKTLYKIVFSLSLLLCFSLNSNAQTIINLSAPESGTIDHVARQEINFLKGYSYTPSTTSVMHAYIDASAVGDVSYTGTFFNDLTQQHSINTQYAVGLTKGDISVSASGGTTYNINFSLPLGTMGMIPSVGINYNSQSGNGLLGMGWNLTTLSVITRGGQTIYHNGKTEGVLMNNNDAFILDGMRLIAITGNNGEAGTIYSTEQESFSKITSLGTSGTGPSSFLIETKDGKKIEYGIDDQARIKGIDGSTVMVWYIRKVTDLNGNYMEYKYTVKESQLVLDEILYTGNIAANLLPYNKIKFYYKKRSDVNSSYVAGKEIKSDILIEKVTISSEDKLYREYQFVYGYNLYTFLTEVVEVGSDGSRFNSTAFQYGETGDAVTPVSIPNNIFTNEFADFYPGDYTGDGISDLLAAYPKGGSVHTNLKLFQGSSTGSFTKIHEKTLSQQEVVYTEDIDNSGNIGYYGSDFDGNGKNDYLTLSIDENGNYYTLNSFNINYSQGSSFTNSIVHVGTEYNQGYKSDGIRNFVQVGDFDGDGAGDILTILLNSSGQQEISIYFPIRNEIKRITNTQGANTIPMGSFGQRGIQVMDFDGDGKSELLVLIENIFIYEFSIENGQLIEKRPYAFGSEAGNYAGHTSKVWPADFNGDGLTDLLTLDNGSTWTLHYSLGKEITENANSTGIAFEHKPLDITTTDLIKFRIGDFNGDGKTDLAFISEYPAEPYRTMALKFDFYYSNGKDFVHIVNETGIWYEVTYLIDILPGDFNGDGRTDWLYFSAFTNDASLHLFNKESRQFFLKKVADGFNNTHEFLYQPITNSSVYSKNITYQYPLNVLSFPFYVVNSHKQPDGNGGINETTYLYENAVIHKTGKGFLGFLKTTASNVLSDSKMTYQNQLNLGNGFFTSSSQINTVQQLSTNVILSGTVNIYNCNALGGKRYWCFTSSLGTIDAVKGVINSTENEYNNTFGNVSKSTTTIKNWNSAVIHTNIVETSYAQFGTWIPSHPVSSTITSTRVVDGAAPYARSISYSYDSKGNLLSTIADPNDSKKVTNTINSYNVLGLPLSQSISASGVQTITNSMEYDNKGRVIKKINALNQFEQFSYDSFGRVLSNIQINGLTTTQSYDGFGRVSTTVLPNSVVINQSLNWQINNGTNANVNDISTIYSSVTSALNTPRKEIWFDSFGREKISKEDRVSSLAVYMHKVYDDLGNIAWQTAPHFISQTPVVISNEYNDILHRISQSNVSGLSTPTEYAYTDGNGFTTTVVTSAQGTSTQKTDATGLLVNSIDDGGALTYSYYSSGNLKSADLNGLEMVANEYDLQGNKTKMSDKNAGQINYVYDAFGRITSQDDNGKTISMQYDVMGRITQKTNNEGSTTYDYYTEGKEINALKTVTGVGGMQQNYTYSADFGRLIKIQEQIGNEVFITQMEYDNLGNQTKMTYPSGFSVKKFYNNVGEVYKITDETENTTIWQVTSINEYGKHTEYSTGNGKITKKEYDVHGLPKRFSAVGVYDIQMTFNAETGNLTSRKDNLQNLTENFTYDNLNRLTSTQLAGQTILNISYSNNGNIQSKSDVGTYTYDQNKVNAVAKIFAPDQNDLNTSVISQQIQQIEYTSFNKAKKLTENGYELNIYYGVDEERKKSEIKQGNIVVQNRYYLGIYEKTVDANTNLTSEVHYISSPDGIVAMYVKENGIGTLHYLYKDHLGTPLIITNSSGAVEYKQNFDAWGRRRNPNNWTYDMSSYTTSQPNWMYRGYTGHEHMSQFTLINMNGRMYDPVVGRMLSPDKYIQSKTTSQNYNRYSYVINNPLKYTDPSGDFLGTILTAVWDFGATIFTKGGIDPWGTRNSRAAAWKQFDPTAPWSKTNKAFKIDAGVFRSDPNRSVLGRVWEVYSRFNWQALATVEGNLYSHFRNITGQVTDVTYYAGATLVNSSKPQDLTSWGLTLGSYINSQNIEADPYNSEIFRHEFGHTLQSKNWGPLYMTSVAIPSGLGGFLDYYVGINNHDQEWYEVNANRLSEKYFTKYNPDALNMSKGGTPWNKTYYPTNYVFNWYTIPSILIGYSFLFFL